MKNLLLRVFRRIKNPIIMLLLLILPPSLTFVIAMWNWLLFWEGYDLELLIFQWTSLYHIIWFICGGLTGAFYIYHILFKGSYLYLFGVPLQIGVFVFTWIWWLILSGPLDRFDTLEIEDTSYHLIQTSANATGILYLFACEEHICDFDEIAYVDSSKFFDAEMKYDETTETIYVRADLGFDIQEIIVPLK